MRQRLCKVCGGWHYVDAIPHNCQSHDWPMQYLSAPMVVRDTQRPLMSMTNGKIYDSKSEMRKEYKRAGVIEVGNEKPPRPKPDVKAYRKDRQAAIGRALSRTGFGA